jgi:hypothetical protein
MRTFVLTALSCFLCLSAGTPVHGQTLPPNPPQLPWLGGGGLSIYMPTADMQAFRSTLNPGLARGSETYNTTNTDTFAWRRVQRTSSNDWDWTAADTLVAYAQSNFPGVSLIFECSMGCAVYNNNGVLLTSDPSWACGLSTDQYVAAKSAFINAMAARYSTNIWGIEIENEPTLDGTGPSGSKEGYNRHIALLQACQPARQYCRLIGWACQGPFPSWFTYLAQRGFTNLCDAVSWHMYAQKTQPPDVTVQSSPGDATFAGNLDQWMQWLRNQVGQMPIVVDEVGLEPNVPVRMAKVMIMLRAYDAMIQLHVWSRALPPGEWGAFNSSTANPYANPYRHAQQAAWAAYWLGNDTFVSQTVDSNVFIYAFGNRTYAWCLEGTVRACQPSGWDSITDIYGNSISPILLTDAVTVFNGHGSLTMTNNTQWSVLRLH